jgi:crotonobetainyl-CoA:carnitine CoA-transferase CaiB-like acyl-CoA transferase
VVLADMGAEVIKVERPGAGERGRATPPFIDGPDGQRVSARFLGMNRNKKSITLDLRDPRCTEALLKMVRVSDVLLDNWGPGALRRLGLGYEVLEEANPGLIYASITGYGDPDAWGSGPYSDWPANNPSVQGMGGWMQVTGAPGGPPQMVGDSIGDSVPGVWAALGIVLALETRRKTGRGQHVDMAMYDCMVAHTTSGMPVYQATGLTIGRSREDMTSAQITLRAKDGYVVLSGARGEEKWVALWRLIGREELAQDPRYLGRGISGEFYFGQIVPALEEWSLHLSKWDVAGRLTELGFSMGVVQGHAELDQCPHLEGRKMFIDAGDSWGGSFRAVRTPIQLTACVEIPAGTPPLLGQHNREILCGIGGMTEEDLDRLRADGVV